MLEKLKQADIPQELVFGWPRSVLLGDEKLIVEQHQGIYTCTEQEIILKTLCGLLVITGEKLSLTLKEFELLKLLVLSRGKVLTRDFLLDRIWGYEFYGETRTVDVHIRHIRQKLGDDQYMIETVRGVGYLWSAE